MFAFSIATYCFCHQGLLFSICARAGWLVAVACRTPLAPAPPQLLLEALSCVTGLHLLQQVTQHCACPTRLLALSARDQCSPSENETAASGWLLANACSMPLIAAALPLLLPAGGVVSSRGLQQVAPLWHCHRQGPVFSF